MLPAASVAVAVRLWLPLARPPLVDYKAPLPLADDTARTASTPSNDLDRCVRFCRPAQGQRPCR